MRHHDLLVRAASEIDNSIDLLDQKTSEEIILIGLHNALRYLGQITGETTTEDMLTRIFATFASENNWSESSVTKVGRFAEMYFLGVVGISLSVEIVTEKNREAVTVRSAIFLLWRARFSHIRGPCSPR